MTKRAAATEATRSRIVDATRALHIEQGVARTSWDDIARRAGVGVGTVYRHFPSLDELVPACGRVSMANVALPGPDEIRATFEPIEDAASRVERLVGEVFAIYERGSADIYPTRHEAHVHPSLAEAGREVEAGLGRLVDVALEPLDVPEPERRLVRAMVDLDTWQALRNQGLGAQEAVAAVADMLARRLAPA